MDSGSNVHTLKYVHLLIIIQKPKLSVAFKSVNSPLIWVLELLSYFSLEQYLYIYIYIYISVYTISPVYWVPNDASNNLSPVVMQIFYDLNRTVLN